MTHVLHIGKYYPPDNGGIESVTASLARGTVAAGFATTVLCFADKASGDEDDGGVRVRRVRQHLKLASQPLGARYLGRALRYARHADIAHVHTPNMLAALIVLLMPHRLPVVVHWHSDVVGKGWLARALRPLEQAMLRRADRIIATSAAYAAASRSLREHADKVSVVALGVGDVAARASATQAELRATLPEGLRAHIGEHPLVLCVGRLVHYKGYATLIDAATRLSGDAAIVIVGGGALAADLQARIDDAGLGSRILLAGRIPCSTLEILRRLASVFCMPSIERSEAFGVALIEAMASGLPLVATHIEGSGVPWVNQHDESGLNVAPSDPAELAQALDRLLFDDALRARLSAGARRRYEQLFTERAMVDATMAIYRELIPARATASTKRAASTG